MIEQRILGTWVYPINEDRPEHEYSHFTDQGRVVGFILWPHKPGKYVPMRTWYEVVQEGLLRIKLSPKGTSWDSSYYLKKIASS